MTNPDDTTVILAAGTASRWTGAVAKHVVPVFDGEPLIHRTVRLCREHGRIPLIVLPLGDPGMLLTLPGINHGIPGGPTTCASLLNTVPYWTGTRVYVLLADVLYSHWAWSQLFLPRDDIWFLGTPSEIHALGFSLSQFAAVEAALRIVIAFADRRKTPHLARLWGLYRQLTSCPLDRHVEAGRYFITAPPHCESMDFDHYDDWLVWQREHPSL